MSQYNKHDYDTILANRGLPKIAFVNYHGKVVAVKRGEMGHYPVTTAYTADELNKVEGNTPLQVECMLNGSMFGWETPGANPSHPLAQRMLGRTDEAPSL